jgi:hypothetical protein
MSNGEIVDLLGGGQGVLNVVPMAGVVSELAAGITEIDAQRESKTSQRPESRTA